MLKDFILLLLIISISAKNELLSPNIEFDVNTTFDENNHVFNFSNEAQEGFFLVDIFPKTILKYEYKCVGSEGNDDLVGQTFFIIKAQPGECTINITSSSWVFKVGGAILIHPFNKEIKITDFNSNIYQLKHWVTFNEDFPYFVFTVSNLRENTTAEFSYGKVKINTETKNITLSNPFEICQGNVCKNNTEEFTFVEGNDYKINIKNEKVEDGTSITYYLTSFKILKKSDVKPTDSDNPYLKSSNLLMNPIIYLILFLLF